MLRARGQIVASAEKGEPQAPVVSEILDVLAKAPGSTSHFALQCAKGMLDEGPQI